MERTTHSWFFVCACQNGLFWLKAWRMHPHVMIGSLRSSCQRRQWRRSFCSVCRLRAHVTPATVKLLLGVAQQHWLDWLTGLFPIRWRPALTSWRFEPRAESDQVQVGRNRDQYSQKKTNSGADTPTTQMSDITGRCVSIIWPVSCADCRAVTAFRCCFDLRQSRNCWVCSLMQTARLKSHSAAENFGVAPKLRTPNGLTANVNQH